MPSRNFFSRRFLRNDSSQRGTPKAAGKADAERAAEGRPSTRRRRRTRRGRAPRGDHQELLLRPGQAGLRDPHRQAAGSSAFFCRTSISLSVSSTCSRRDFWRGRAAPRAGGGSGRATFAMRRLGLPLARQDRIDEHPGDAADRDRDQEEQRRCVCMFIAASLSASAALGDFGGVERGGEPLFLAVVAGAVPELRPADAGRAVAADQLAVGVLAHHVVDEEVLGDDDVAFHADHLGDVGDAARAVAQARRLDDDVDRGADHLADGLRRQREAAHGDHRFDAGQRLARRVGVQRAHRAVVAGVHRLQQVERLGSAHFADDDALGPHAQAVLDQVAHGDLAFAFEVGRPGFQAHHMRLLQLQLGGVFAGDDALVVVDVVGQAVEQRGLARAGAAGNEGVDAAAADDLQDLGAFRRDRAELDQLVERELVLLELADGERRAVDRQRRRDRR